MLENSETKRKQNTSSDQDVAEGNLPEDIGKDIDDIERHESDQVLEVEDAEANSKLNKPTPWFKKKKVYIPSLVGLILVIVFLIPSTRYRILGLFIKESFSIKVVDSQNGQPVTFALVSLDGRSANTDNKGQVTLRVKVGKGKLEISKKYYSTTTTVAFVPLHSKSSATFSVQATGRQVPISLVNKIGGKPVANATISADGTQAKTDSHGDAVLVLPADKSSDKATISAAGFNNQDVTITITTNSIAANNFQVLPSGSVYFLSNASGRIDVVKSNLDGSGLTTVVAGTGNEDPNGTFIMPSPDWKYVALVSVRSGTYPSLYLINTSNDSFIQVDSGADNFALNGWTSDDFLVYTDSLVNTVAGGNGNESLKTVNAATDKLTTIDSSNGQTTGVSDVDEAYNDVNVLGDGTILYLKSWQGDTEAFNGLQATLSSSLENNTSKRLLKDFSEDTYYPYISSLAAGPLSMYYYANPNNGGTTAIFEYSNGSVQQLSGSAAIQATSTQSTPSTYFISPSGKSSLWSAIINGHSAVTVGESDGTGGKQVAVLDNTFTVYGWYTDNYILLSKNANELYVMPAAGVSDPSQLIKISNYL